MIYCSAEFMYHLPTRCRYSYMTAWQTPFLKIAYVLEMLHTADHCFESTTKMSKRLILQTNLFQYHKIWMMAFNEYVVDIYKAHKW